MRIHIGYELVFQIPAPTPMLMLLSVRPERAGDLERPEDLDVSPVVPVFLFIDSFGNRCAKFVAQPGQLRIQYDNVCRDTGVRDEVGVGAIQHNVNDLPVEVLAFLLSSRYCEVDKLSPIAWNLF